MDEKTLLLLRLFGYLLNVALLLFAAVKYPHHRLALTAWVVWLTVILFSVLARYTDRLSLYFLLIDYIATPLLFVNAVLTAHTLLTYEPKKK